MKNLFRGYFADDKDVIDSLWSECVFVFDANILLNLYRYSDSTRNEFLHILQTIKQRIWLPNRAAEEYFKNRTKVIYDQSKAYDDSISKINVLKQTFENSRSHPFISSQTKEKTEDVFSLLSDELKESKKVHSTRLTHDQIKAQLAILFENKVGPPFSDDVLNKILDDGKIRYSEKIPPGFEDADKADESDDSISISDRCRRYGDYILWSQILEFAETNNQNVILVTDDNKKDWWEIQNKIAIGPRPELVEEFFNKTGHNIFMYKPDKFLELSKEYLGESITTEAVDEVRALRKNDQKIYYPDLNAMKVLLDSELEQINGKVHSLRIDEATIDSQICELDVKLNELWSKNENMDDVKESIEHNLNQLILKKRAYKSQITELLNQREHINSFYRDSATNPNKKYNF